WLYHIRDNDYRDLGIDTAFHNYDSHGSVTNSATLERECNGANMPRIAKLACTLSALAVLVSCGGSANTPPPIRVLSIATTSLSDGFVTFAYVQMIQADGGVAPFSWAVSSGSLPHNLTLGSSSTNSVTISGTPDTVQTAVTFAIQVTDAKRQTATKLF